MLMQETRQRFWGENTRYAFPGLCAAAKNTNIMHKSTQETGKK